MDILNVLINRAVYFRSLWINLEKQAIEGNFFSRMTAVINGNSQTKHAEAFAWNLLFVITAKFWQKSSFLILSLTINDFHGHILQIMIKPGLNSPHWPSTALVWLWCLSTFRNLHLLKINGAAISPENYNALIVWKEEGTSVEASILTNSKQKRFK